MLYVMFYVITMSRPMVQCTTQHGRPIGDVAKDAMTSDDFSEIYGTLRLGKKFQKCMELCNGHDGTEKL